MSYPSDARSARAATAAMLKMRRSGRPDLTDSRTRRTAASMSSATVARSSAYAGMRRASASRARSSGVSAMVSHLLRSAYGHEATRSIGR